MSEDASAGRLYADVVADVSGFRKDAQTKLKTALKGVQAEAKAKVAFSASQARIALNAALREAAKDEKLAAAKAKVVFDPVQVRTALNRALKEASRGADVPRVRVQVDVDDARARAQLAKLGGRTSLTVGTDADTSGAERDVEGMRKRQGSKPVDIDVRINKNALSQVGGALASLTRFPAIASGVLVAAGAIANLTGGLFAMGSAASQAVGVLAALPNLAGVAAQGIGSLVLGFAGIGDAVKALGKAQEAAGASATKSAGAQTAAADAVRSAQERVARAQESATERVREAQRRLVLTQEAAVERLRSAQEGLSRARENAAERAFDAERRLADVQAAGASRAADAEAQVVSAAEARIRAVRSLGDAIEQATERAQDLALQLSGAALDEEGAEIALERAANRLKAITGPGSTASDLDKREADLAYRQAVQRLAEIRESNEDLAKEKAESDRKGIEGSDEVVAAQERVIDAAKNEAAARKNLKSVITEANRDIADAQFELAKTQRDNARDILDAQRNLSRAAFDGARDVAEARRDVLQAQRDGARAVLDAQRDVARAMATAATATGTTSAAATGLASAMKNLSPAGQKFARFVNDTLKPAFKDLKFAVQEALLPPLQKALKIGLPILDVLKKGLVGSAKVIGGLAVDLAKMITQPEFKSDVGRIMASNNRAMKSFGKAGLAIIDILRRLAVVAGPVLLEPFANWVRELAESANKSKALTKGRMIEFLSRAAETARKLGKLFGSLMRSIYKIGQLARPSGDTLLDSLVSSAEALEKNLADPETQKRISDFFENTVPVMREFGDLLKRIGEIFFRFGEITGGGSLDGVFWVLNRILDILEAITNLPGGGAVLAAIFTLAGVGLGLALVAKGLGSIVTNIARLSKFTGVTKLLGALANTKAATAVTGAIKGGAAKAGGKVSGAVAGAASALSGTIGDGVSRAKDKIKSKTANVKSKASSKVGGGVSKVKDFVASRVAAGKGRGDKGAASVGMLGGNLIAAGIEKAGAAAGRAARAVSGYASSLAKTAGPAVMKGLRAAPGAIASAASTAGRAVGTVASLAGSYGRVALQAVRAGAAQVAMAAKTAIVKGATIAWTAAQRILNAVMNMNPIGRLILIIAALVGGVVWAYKNVGWFRKGVDTAFKAIAAVGKWLWEKILRPVFQALVAFFVNTLVPKFLWLKGVWDKAWRAVGTALTWVWDKVLKPVLQKLIGFFVSTVVPKVLWLKAVWDETWKRIGALLSGVWNNTIKPLFDKLVVFVTKTIPDSFKRGVSLIGKFWEALKKAAKDPVGFVVNTVWNKGLLPIWNWVADKINPAWTLKPITGFATGGLVGYRRGGVLPGTSSYRDGDDQLVAMRRGEGVYVSEAMRDPYERARLFAVNAAAMSGRDLSPFQGGYARGGLVGFAKGGILDGVLDFFKDAKDSFVNGMKSSLLGAINPLIGFGRNTFGKTGFGAMALDATQKVATGAINHILGLENKIFAGDATGVLKAAAKYLGQGDDRGVDNSNQFTRRYGYAPGTPWCAMFASAAIQDAGATKSYPGTPTAAVATFNARMRHVSPTAGRPGDLATYGSNDHVNIIEAPFAGGYKTIGGNEGPVVKRGTRFAPATVLRPAFALGGLVDVFAQKNLDPADRTNPLVRLMSTLSPSVAKKVGAALSQVPALNRDSGGALPPGTSMVHNLTGGLEWVLTPEAVAMLGGPRAVQAINDRARVHRSGASARASISRAAARARTGSGDITQNIYPQPRQSEHEIAMGAARKLGAMIR